MVSNVGMRRRWQLILPAIGLVLFGGATYESPEGRKYENIHGRYFYWASIRLDSHQTEHNPVIETHCAEQDNCVSWNPAVIEDPGWLTKLLILSGFPALLVGIPVVRFLGRLGANELWSFIFLMPLLIAAWFYLVGRLFDRWISKKKNPPGAPA